LKCDDLKILSGKKFMKKKTSFANDKSFGNQPLPTWTDAERLLPSPVFDSCPLAIETYWAAWEIAIKNMRSPTSENGFVSNYMYMDFSQAVFAHDTTFMVVYGRYAKRLFSAVESFDNFYIKQHSSGEICREIGCDKGDDYWPNMDGDPMRVDRVEPGSNESSSYWFDRPSRTEHPEPSACAVAGLNDPSCMAWGEIESFKITGDLDRLRQIFPVQQAWYKAFKIYLRAESGFFVTDWASVDNHPRNPFLGYGIDVICQVLHLAHLLCEIGELIGDQSATADYQRDIEEMTNLINKYMWDEKSEFFYDLSADLEQISIKSIMGFWPMLAQAANSQQCIQLRKHLENPETFNRKVRIPTVAANEPSYTSKGSYIRGGVFPFTNHMVIRGLECFGEELLAHDIAMNHWRSSVELFGKTGTIWEYLQPDAIATGAAGDPDNPGENARPDFAGWGALPVIAYLIEYAIGLKVDAPANKVKWNLTETGKCGCRQLAFGKVVTDLIALDREDANKEPQLEIKTNHPYSLILKWGKGNRKTIKVEPI
jgi:mannosylglycerate hydrolase MGH1-like protein